MPQPLPNRGEVWWINLNPTKGREQAGRRPAVVVSTNKLNHGPANLVIVLPMTRTDRRLPTWVQVDPPEGGVSERSFIMCDQVRTVSRDRLEGESVGTLEPGTLGRASKILCILMQLA